MYNVSKYQYNVAIVKDYNGRKFKISVNSIVRTKGIEKDNNFNAKCSVNDEKLESNLSRVKARLYEYAICNDWDYFVTLTLDNKKYDRTNLKKFVVDLRHYVNNYNKKYGLKIKRLFVPELHEDLECWHIHGFIMGLPENHLRKFTLREKLPQYISDKLRQGHSVYEWVPYKEKFGYTVIEPIRNHEAEIGRAHV